MSSLAKSHSPHKFSSSKRKSSDSAKRRSGSNFKPDPRSDQEWPKLGKSPDQQAYLPRQLSSPVVEEHEAENDEAQPGTSRASPSKYENLPESYPINAPIDSNLHLPIAATGPYYTYNYAIPSMSPSLFESKNPDSIDSKSLVKTQLAPNPMMDARSDEIHDLPEEAPNMVLEADFKVHHSKYFKFGRVFKILWTEPKGQGTPSNHRSDVQLFRTKFGEEYHTSIRRFVIARTYKGHCLCLPIFIYRNQGTDKPGVKPQNHAIIYTESKKQKGVIPKEAPNEARLEYKPIRMEPKTNRHQLTELSRLNYAKIYTVEHNVKVCFIGDIHPDSIRQFVEDYNYNHFLLSPDSEKSWELDDLDEALSVMRENSINGQASGLILDIYQDTVKDSNKDDTERLSIIPGSITKSNLPPEVVSPNPNFPNRRSSITSSSTLASSILGSNCGVTVTTTSDAVSFLSYIDQDPLIALFTEDQKLSSLFLKVSQLVSVETFKSRMQRMLLNFGKHLRAEARSSIEKKATRVVKLRAQNIALGLLRKVYSVRFPRPEDPAYRLQLGLEKWTEDIESTELSDKNVRESNRQEHEASESEGDEEDVEKDSLSQHLIESFIKPSQALVSLRQGFVELLEFYEGKSRRAKEIPLPEGSGRSGEKMLNTTLRIDRTSSFDHTHSVLNKVWPENNEKYEYLSTQKVQYQACWDVVQFISGYFPKGQQLGNIITLTGDANDAEALPCGEYLKRTWPAIGDVLLASVEELIRTSTRGCAETEAIKIVVETGPDSQNAPTTNKSLLTFSVHANFEQHHDTVSAISWLCAAVRHGEREGLSISKAFLETTPRTDQTRKILIKMYPLVPITENGMCWHSLFAFSVIAYEFPISPRKAGHGLELSFRTMLMLARSIRITEFNDGLVAEGLENLVVPVAKLEEDDALQWHLEWKNPTLSSAEISLGDTFLNRYKTKNLQELADKRTFLGWAESALVMVGTEQFNQDFALENVKRSEASVLRNVGFRPVSYSITLGTNAIPGLYIQGETMIAQASDGNYTATRGHDKVFRDRLHDSAKRNVIIANWRGKTSWYLPETNVILYMIHLYIKERGYSILQAENDTSPLRTADFHAIPSADGGQAARETLSNSTNLRVSAEETSFTLNYLIRKYLFELELERQELHLLLKTARELNKAAPANIVGYELLDVVLEKPCLLAKAMKFHDSQPWAFLADESPVLFVQDFGQAIVASDRCALCDLWMQVPPGRNYLVAAALAIKNLLESNGGRKLSD